MGDQAITEQAVKNFLNGEHEEYRFFVFDSVTSTNEKAKEIEVSNESSGDFVVLAESQTKGRGRGRHVWESPVGVGLYFSMIKKVDLEMRRFPLLNLVAGISAAETILETSGVHVTLKWPNDLLLSGKKLGGILLESLPQNKTSVLIGIGINVHNRLCDFSTELQPRVTSLFLYTGESLDRNSIIAVLLKRLEQWLKIVKTNPEKVVEEWKRWTDSMGKKVRILHDKKYIAGVFRDLDINGFMILETESGEKRKVTSGELCC